jgi:hypothetical protein
MTDVSIRHVCETVHLRSKLSTPILPGGTRRVVASRFTDAF